MKKFLPIISILLVGIVFRFYQILNYIPFFGDQAWFYLSARDALLTGKFPLLGITASITWLHQGVLYTYFLIPGLALTQFNPYSGIFLTAVLSVVNIVLIYYLGRLLFSRKASLLSALIFAVSPLVVIHSRISYHTSLIPLIMTITAILLAKKQSFLSGLFLGFLYSLHLLTLVFWLPFIFISLRSHLSFHKQFLGFILSLLPFLISGPIATGGIFVWLFYKLLTGFPDTNSFSYYVDLFTKFLMPDLFSVFQPLNPGPGSMAYFILLFVPLALCLGLTLSRLPKYFVYFVAAILIVVNGSYLFRNRYLINSPAYGYSLPQRLNIAKQILSTSESSIPNITVTGPGSEFASTADTYKYLVWWLGYKNPPPGKNYKFVVDESNLQLRVIE